MLVNRHGVVENVNPALSSIIGYEADELIESGLSVFLGPDHLARMEDMRAPVESLLTGTIPSFEFEQPFVTRDGRSIWLGVCVSLMQDEKGELLDLVAVIQDVTTRKDAERVKGIPRL